VGLLEEMGPRLFLTLIVQAFRAQRTVLCVSFAFNIKGRPYRVLYSFDPRRVAMLLIGANKTGDDGLYDRYVPIADR